MRWFVDQHPYRPATWAVTNDKGGWYLRPHPAFEGKFEPTPFDTPKEAATKAEELNRGNVDSSPAPIH